MENTIYESHGKFDLDSGWTLARNKLSRQWSVCGSRGWSVSLGLRHDPDSYDRWGVFRSGWKPDGAMPCRGIIILMTNVIYTLYLFY